MRIRLLGPLRVWDGAKWTAINEPRQRVMLSVLLAERGRTVAKDRLIHDIWGDRPTRTATTAVNGYAMRLRRLLKAGAAGEIVTRSLGYELVTDADALDANVFERRVSTGKVCVSEGRLAEALGHLASGLSLWQGEALADVPATPMVTTMATRLTQLRLSTLEDRLDIQLSLGQHAEIVDELAAFVEDHPLRERLSALLMTALYRCGRRAEALAAYRSVRAVLVEETGLEPGPALSDLERAVLNDDPSLTAPEPALRGYAVATPAVVVPHQLPTAVADFVGRHDHLRLLDGLLPDLAPAIVTIDGLAGVGKTSLALHWARQARHHFPNGQLFIDMRGCSRRPPVQPLAALSLFLQALGVRADQVPLDVEQAASLYRSMLAGKRVLVMLDNADHPAQVRPLLPGEPGCLVIITGRHELRGLTALDGATRLRLEVLTPAEARELLAVLIGLWPGSADVDCLDTLARLCGYLPLAMRIAVANLKSQGLALPEYNRRLGAGDRLAALAVAGDPIAATANAFDLSYDAQPEQARRLFRLLGLIPGADVTVQAAAALAGLEPAHAEALLESLVRANLLEPAKPGRFAFHDLVRLYARQRCRADDDDRDAALGRLYRYYLRGAVAAAEQIYPQVIRLPLPAGLDQTCAPEFETRQAARTWLEAERTNMVTAIISPGPAHREAAWRLADALRGHFFVALSTADWLPVAEAARAHAESQADPAGQAAAQFGLAMVWWFKNRYKAAVDGFTQANLLARKSGWAEAESGALGNLSSVYFEMGQLAKAEEQSLRSLELFKRLGNASGQAVAWLILGNVRLGQGRLAEAVKYYRQALQLGRGLGNWYAEGVALADLGEAYYWLGRIDEALSCLTGALARYQEMGVPYRKANTLRMLALVHADSGDMAAAFSLIDEAIALAQDSGDRWVQAQVLICQGILWMHTTKGREATVALTAALRLAREMDARLVQAQALHHLAQANFRTGQVSEAVRCAGEAARISHESGYGIHEWRTATARLGPLQRAKA
ncbi:MAG TPA: BTAD domain-containing putative transcriptional regulator [Candidatus Limnocylindrales bacterium]|nr:BTAD domain-containing putative transcriptional regulator [Candidatus Limnocylindrales bacterium]